MAVKNYRIRKMGVLGFGITARQEMQLKEEYSNLCVYCGKRYNELTIDHIVPISKGGEHDINNTVPACRSCNASKNDRPLLLWMYYRMDR
jgi:5-methylcytosine-specific restriction endonuclease McrA